MKIIAYDLSWLESKEDIEYALNYCKDKKKDCYKNLKMSALFLTIIAGAIVGYSLNSRYAEVIFYFVYAIAGIYLSCDFYKKYQKYSDLIVLLEAELERYIK